MNGREAVIALLDGKTIMHPALPSRRLRMSKFEIHVLFPGDDAGYPWCGGLEGVVCRDGWELYSEPLTDEQLIAEWERKRESILQGISINSVVDPCTWAGAYELCARQLRGRKL